MSDEKSTQNMNLDVSSYNLIELFDLLSVDTDSEEPISEQVQNNSTKIINQFSEKNNLLLVEFFENVRDSILQQSETTTENETLLISGDTTNSIEQDSRNQIKRDILIKTVNVDSRFRQSGVSHNFSYEFPEKITNITSMVVTSFEIPNTWYQFSNNLKNNDFKIKLYNINTDESSPPIDMSYQIVIPNGTYTLLGLKEIINLKLTNVSLTSDPLQCVIFDVNEQTNKTFFRVNVEDASYNPYDSAGLFYSPDFEFSIHFTSTTPNHPFAQSLGYMLGFREENYYVTKENIYHNPYDIKSYMGTLISEAVYKKDAYNYFFLTIDENTGNYVDTMITEYGSLSQIMARFQANPINNHLFGTDSDCGNIMREYLGPKNIATIKVRLTDAYGNDVNLNGADFSFTLAFTKKYTS